MIGHEPVSPMRRYPPSTAFKMNGAESDSSSQDSVKIDAQPVRVMPRVNTGRLGSRSQVPLFSINDDFVEDEEDA